MCLITFDYRPDSPVWLRLLANRDEFFARPTASLEAWTEDPDIIGGRDLVAGGSWLALHRRGRFAAITNVRDTALVSPPDGPSRGHLVPKALNADDLPAWLEDLVSGEAWSYAGFNLLVGDRAGLWHLHRGRDALKLHRLPAGLYGLSNADLDTPWPKLKLARQGLAESLSTSTWPQSALRVMHQQWLDINDQALPDTGVGLAVERQLAPPFITGETYGTRATTWLEWCQNGHLALSERRFGPSAHPLGETHLSLSQESWYTPHQA
ncbi:NRDE family protein [Onishia niordana]|uniref:NRDE family protein n=1 Tax=Onishia niordana TaxID=2508711 RepID=UPI00109F7190|nr:NRDE family protein [Halomonas niordiana]